MSTWPGYQSIPVEEILNHPSVIARDKKMRAILWTSPEGEIRCSEHAGLLDELRFDHRRRVFHTKYRTVEWTRLTVADARTSTCAVCQKA
jgi:hypothetical protein